MEYVKDLKIELGKKSKEELMEYRTDMMKLVHTLTNRSLQDKFLKRADVCTGLLKKLGVKFDILGRVLSK